MRFKRRYSLFKGDVSLLPMMNVALLLIFFLLLASGTGVLGGKPPAPPVQAGRAEIDVSISREGVLWYNNNEISKERLGVLLAEEARKAADTVLVIRADRDARHGDVVAVMEEAERAGITKVEVADKPVRVP